MSRIVAVFPYGEVLLPSGATWYENPYIWEARDKVQVNYGFRIDSETASGLATKEKQNYFTCNIVKTLE